MHADRRAQNTTNLNVVSRFPRGEIEPAPLKFEQPLLHGPSLGDRGHVWIQHGILLFNDRVEGGHLGNLSEANTSFLRAQTIEKHRPAITKSS